jgi:Lrp/AsnC family leucine-responsive transcriptional regulator
MPVELDDYDISILKSLFEGGRKSFRQISRETGITTPTVKARFERLVNVGFIQRVVPVLDFGKVTKVNANTNFGIQDKNYDNDNSIQQFKKIKKGLKIVLDCDFCHGIIAGIPQVFKFANYERFFCCTSCRSEYKRKFGGRIQSIIEKNAE